MAFDAASATPILDTPAIAPTATVAPAPAQPKKSGFDAASAVPIADSAAAPIPTMTVRASRPPVPVQAQSGDVPSQQAQPTGNFFAGAQGPPPALAPIVQNAAAKYGVPLAVANWVGWHESGWRTDAVGQQTSTGTAKGAWQFKDGTAKEMGLADPHDFITSTDAAMRYLRKLADKNGGDWNKAVEAYGTFSTGMGVHRDAAAKAGFQQFLGNTGATRPASDANRYDGWDQPGGTGEAIPRRAGAAQDGEDDPAFPDDEPGRNYGTLPFSEDATTHEKRWGIGQSEVVRSLARGIRGMGDRMSAPPLTDTRPLNLDELGATLGLGGMPTAATRMFAPTGAAKVAADAAAETAATNRAALGTANKILGYGGTPEGKAAKIIGRRANEDLAGGGKFTDPPIEHGPINPNAPTLALPTGPADNVVANLDRMRASGKPATPVDVLGPNVDALTGSVARKPGTAGAIVRATAEAREGPAAENRAIADARQHLASGPSAYRSKKLLLDQRSVEGNPLYKKAFEGGSMAPLKDQFEKSWNEASKASKEALRDVAVARSQLNAALAKDPVTGGNVYSQSAANEAIRAARRTLQAAESKAAHAADNEKTVRDWMQRAHDDIENDTPGAVWNPRIQQFLDLPRIKKGLAHGYELERIDAVADNVPFNPHEYAVSPDGTVIKVPNMRTLNVAKKGLDAMIAEQRNPMTGRLTEEGRTLNNLRVQLLKELDAVNPDYKAARQVWAGHSASLDAVSFGEKLRDMHPEQIKEEFDAMGKDEQELVRQAASDGLREIILKTGLGSDEAKRLIANTWTKEQYEPIFKTRENFTRYVESVADERLMYDKGQRWLAGSQTAGRNAEDLHNDLTTAGHVVSAASHAAGGSWLHAASAAARAKRDLGLRNNPALNEALARTLMNPDGGPQVVNGKLDFSPPAPPIPAPRGPIYPRQ